MINFYNIHVFEGSSNNSNQSIPFTAARRRILTEYGKKVRFTNLNADMINFQLKSSIGV